MKIAQINGQREADDGLLAKKTPVINEISHD